jgi:hypothetical protein
MRAVIRRGIAVWALSALLQPWAARADPAPPPPPIGPLQYGPPAYPAGVGIPLVPQARSGVAAAADTLSPAPQPGPAVADGIAGVTVSSGALIPTPLG